MVLVPVDIVIDIEYPMADGAVPIIRTNAKREALPEVLEAWLHWKAVSSSRDDRPPVQRDVHRIKVGLALANDEFCTESDTGNESVTIGIVGDVLTRLDELQVLPLE